MSESFVSSTIIKKIGLSLVVVAGFGAVVGIWTLLPSLIKRLPANRTEQALVAFTDGDEYSAYLSETQRLYSAGGVAFGRADVATETPTTGSKDTTGTTTPRTIGTNVQVRGLDEPDLVKTNGQAIYISRQTFSIFAEERVSIEPAPNAVPLETTPSIGADTGTSDRDLKEEPTTPVNTSLPVDKIAPPVVTAETTVIDARTITALKKTGVVADQGQLLLAGKTLAILSGTTVIGYDLTNPAEPKKTWTMPLADGNAIVTGRSSENELLLITQQFPESDRPCPLSLTKTTLPIDLPCGRLYHPREAAPTSVIFAVLRIDPKNGTVLDRVGFTGASGVSTVYVSPSAVYLTYPVAQDQATVEHDFLRGLGTKLPPGLRNRLATLDGYAISSSTRLAEFQQALEQYLDGLGKGERDAFEKMLVTERTAYDQEHQRDVLQTGIVKIDPRQAKVVATGSVPGMLLNQYSVDEFDGYLRVATTVGQNWWGSNAETVNDLYVLDGDLKRKGVVLDLGRDERIYAVRFVRDRGYLVTFKEVDPFFVIDLSDPAAPKLAGELKIPGYSSYLHPLSPTLILGIGQDGAKTKTTLFDVTEPSTPRAVSTLDLGAGWSEVNGDPHAFLHDPDHAAVFVPAGETGVVLTYTGTGLKEVLRTTGLAARRAVVIGDRLIIIGDSSLQVIREADWAVDQTVTFGQQ